MASLGQVIPLETVNENVDVDMVLASQVSAKTNFRSLLNHKCFDFIDILQNISCLIVTKTVTVYVLFVCIVVCDITMGRKKFTHQRNVKYVR